MTLRRALLHFWLSCLHLLSRFFFIIAPECGHVWSRNELPNVCKQALAIIVAAVRAKRESCVAKASQVPHGLTVRWAVQLWISGNCFLELSVGDLALRHSFCDGDRVQKRSC